MKIEISATFAEKHFAISAIFVGDDTFCLKSIIGTKHSHSWDKYDNICPDYWQIFDLFVPITFLSALAHIISYLLLPLKIGMRLTP